MNFFAFDSIQKSFNLLKKRSSIFKIDPQIASTKLIYLKINMKILSL